MPKIEDRKLTPKENYLRVVTGQVPEWMPIYTVGIPMMDGSPMAMAPVTPSLISSHQVPGKEAVDIWGVTWVGNYDTGYMKMPRPYDFLMDDITEWRDIIKAPDLTGIDWEQMYKDDLKKFNVDRENSAMGQGVYVGPFQTLVSYMGFTEGLIALSEEPEECLALLEYITDFYLEVEKRYFEVAKPDVLCMTDDTCSQNSPFISEEMFREFFLPCYKKHAEIAIEAGIPIQFHNCGTAAHYIELCHEEAGVTAWDPAQTVNDLDAFKAKWGNEIAICGGFDPSGKLLDPDCPEELLRETVIDIIDRLAPGGGFAFCGGFVGPMDDENNFRKQTIVEKTATEYGNTFYD